jgi:hypothetical protein
MQTEVIKEFLYKIGISADNDTFSKFNTISKTATAEANALGASLKTGVGYGADYAGTSIMGLRSKLLLVSGSLTLLGGGLFHYVEKTAEGLENLNALSTRLNTSATQIEKLRYIAEINESSASAAQSSLEGLARQAGNTYMGIGRFSARVFKQLGISVKDANGHLKNTYDLMFEIGQKIKGFEAGRQIAVLSKLGIDPSLVKTLTTNIDDVSESFDRMYKSGKINLDKAAEQSNEFVDTMKELHYELGIIGKSVFLSIMPNLTKSVRDAADSFLENMPQIQESLEPIVKSIVKISGLIVDMVSKVLKWGGALIRMFADLNKQTNGLAAWSIGFTYALSRIDKIIRHGPLAAVLLLIGAISWLQDDYKKFKDGAKSAIDWNSNLGKTIIWVKDKLIEFGPQLLEVGIAFYAVRTAVIALTAAMALNPIGLAITAIGAALSLLLPVVIANWDKISAVFTTTIDWIVAKIDYLIDKIKSIGDFMDNIRGDSLKALGLEHTFDWAHAKVQPTTTISPYIARPNNQNINQTTTIHVSGTANAQETANAVAGHQKRINADITRNMQPVTR